MFTFVRIGDEPEMYLEDYSIYYTDTNESFILNDYYDEEGYDRALFPVVSINRQSDSVELYNFFDDDILPSDKPKVLRAIIDFVNLKDILEINNYIVTGDGADIYRQMYNTLYI